MLTLIVARDRNGAIGRDGDMPWHLPEDLKMFQRETLGGALIMGRRTWDSLPVKPLKNRFNCVISRNAGLAEVVVGSVEEALRRCQSEGYHRIYGIGGARVYEDLLPYADRLLVTEVELAVEDADTWFPQFAAKDWRRISDRRLRDSEPGCVLHEYLRRDPASKKFIHNPS